MTERSNAPVRRYSFILSRRKGKKGRKSDFPRNLAILSAIAWDGLLARQSSPYAFDSYCPVSKHAYADAFAGVENDQDVPDQPCEPRESKSEQQQAARGGVEAG